MAAPARRHGDRLASGQHLLRSARLAAELVDDAGVHSHEIVVDVGAGLGRLTQPLAARAASVIAIELDPGFAATLRRRFRSVDHVLVLEADARVVQLPSEPFRVVANLPFGITTTVLRRLLDDPRSPLVGADVIVEKGLATKRCSPRPCTMLSLSWLPWWQLHIERVLPPGCFDPPPPVDAALMQIRRRHTALIEPTSSTPYRAMLARAFADANHPVRDTLAIERRTWARLARDRGVDRRARPHHLDVRDWTAIFQTYRPPNHPAPRSRTARR